MTGGWAPTEMDADREMITAEERECYQKIGLKMDRCLELGKEELTCLDAYEIYPMMKKEEVRKGSLVCLLFFFSFVFLSIQASYRRSFVFQRNLYCWLGVLSFKPWISPISRSEIKFSL